MRRGFLASLSLASALLLAGPAAADPALPVDIPAEPLAASLDEFARQTGVELLFDRDLVGQSRSPVLHGRLPVELALAQLLSGADLSAHRASSGAWIIQRRTSPGSSAPPFITTVPEILVVGRRTQDVDIRRHENDIQPYQVATGDEVVEAHNDNLDQYFQSRETTDTQVPTGDASSQIDLRGLGAEDTLILVDGRRLPGVPGTGPNLDQPDINAIPLHAVERVETLTGTSGGIYGLGALGGVVNVVLRHDTHGLEIHMTTGVNDQGDARRLNLEGGMGFTSNDGRTDISVYASQSWEQPLLEGQNGLTLRGREESYAFAPEDFSPLPTNALVVQSVAGNNLVLKRAYGGASLGSAFTYLPSGFSGGPSALAAALTQHAGQVDLSLSSTDKQAYLVPTPSTTSIIVDVRHRLAAGFEAYFDALILRDSSYLGESDSTEPGELTLPRNSPQNPFRTAINVFFPTAASGDYQRTIYTTNLYTAGAIAPLPHNWRGDAEVSFGSSGYEFSTQLTSPPMIDAPTGASAGGSPFGSPAPYRTPPCSSPK